MDMQTAVRICFSKYADITGRARRSEFWWFALFVFGAHIVLGILDGLLFGTGGGGLIGSLFSLAVLLPSITVAGRRLHDIGRSAWWLLICLIPVAGWLVLLWWYIQPGEVGPNEYGPDPLAGEHEPLP